MTIDVEAKLAIAKKLNERLARHLGVMIDYAEHGRPPECDCKMCGDCSDAYWFTIYLLEAKAALAASKATP